MYMMKTSRKYSDINNRKKHKEYINKSKLKKTIDKSGKKQFSLVNLLTSDFSRLEIGISLEFNEFSTWNGTAQIKANLGW